MDAEELWEKLRALEEAQTELKREVSRLLPRQPASAAAAAPAASPRLRLGPQPSPAASTRPGRAGAGAGLSRRHYSLILQSLGQAVHVLDLHGKVLSWNRYAEYLYGYSASEAIGQDITNLIIHRDDIGALNNIIGKIFTGKCWRGKFPVRNKYGDRFYIAVDATPFYDDDGRLTGLVCLADDVRILEELMGPSGSNWNAAF
ncbi:hypothetical protein ACP4OV_005366 [Aristida adscensionis]